jgi:hypothetical protein
VTGVQVGLEKKEVVEEINNSPLAINHLLAINPYIPIPVTFTISSEF